MTFYTHTFHLGKSWFNACVRNRNATPMAGSTASFFQLLKVEKRYNRAKRKKIWAKHILA